MTFFLVWWMMLMDLVDDCNLSRLGVHCLWHILREVVLPRAIELEMLNFKQF